MQKSALIALLKTRRFFPVFLTQLFGAFNDNFYKTAMLVFIGWNISGQISNDNSATTGFLVMLAQAIFILPFFIFSGTAGQLADRYNKAHLIQILKFFEIPIAFLAVYGFISGNIALLFTALFLLAVQFSFFGPVKYSILPSHLKREELLAGNGLVSGATFVAILLSMVLGTSLVVIPKIGPMVAGMISLLLAGAGFLSSFYILNTEASNPHLKINWNFFSETFYIIKETKKDKTIFSTILGISWFWLIGSIYLTLLIPYAREVIHAKPSVFILFLVIFTIGIAAGSLAINRILKGKIDVRYGFPSLLGISVFTVFFIVSTKIFPVSSELIGVFVFLQHPSSWAILVSLFGLAICAGFFVVPLIARLQILPQSDRISQAIAANNILNSFFMVVSALICAILIKIKVTILAIFFLLALANLYVSWKNKPIKSK